MLPAAAGIPRSFTQMQPDLSAGTMSQEEIFAAATAIIRDLAKTSTPPYDAPNFNLQARSENILHRGKITLPGSDNPSKGAFETELSSLASRIQYLEARASTASHQALPDTPSEWSGPSSPFDPRLANGQTRTGSGGPVRQGSASGSTRNGRLSGLLPIRAGGRGLNEETSNQIHEAAEQIDNHLSHIQSLKNHSTALENKVHELQQQLQDSIVQIEQKEIVTVQRELRKHQQANEAFQKAFREIGTIITNVANGDLSHKVQIHDVEMDPEIVTFKKTINTMMDQLQVFGSEVSRVAREVGTEGILGGQARITGVNGIWKELTENGELLHTVSFILRY